MMTKTRKAITIKTKKGNIGRALVAHDVSEKTLEYLAILVDKAHEIVAQDKLKGE